MPELPEVEVTRRGIAPVLEGRRVTAVRIRQPRLRWPVDGALEQVLPGMTVRKVGRRGKYLLLDCAGEAGAGCLILHLGMSGSLRFVAPATPPARHDHFDLEAGQAVLRLTDPRRFGAVLWHPAHLGNAQAHPLLSRLGVEPFDAAFTPQLLYQATRGRKTSIKQALLSGEIVVGVGNIYASESLFRARINPRTAAGRIGIGRYARLVPQIRAVLEAAIAKGGSTLRDFRSSEGPGYFQLDYRVYDREGAPCRVCRTPIRRIVQGQRSTFYCPACQR